MSKKDTSSQTTIQSIPPIIAVLGHVDHGKTSLLDAIRKTNVVSKEHGGITQKIGASTIDIMHEGQERRITFIDTPGHEAFVKMRGRGVQAADIGLLIVSSVDGVMPQTKESIKLLQQQLIPFIVVLTKVDLAEKQIEKTKEQLSRENVLLEGYGGDIPVIEVSARTRQNIKELLDLILLVFDLKISPEEKEKHTKESFMAIIIESKLDQKIGPKATIIVKHGSISVREAVVADLVEGKIRALINDRGQSVQTVSVGDAAEVLGFEKVPKVGSVVYNKTPKAVSSTVQEPQSTKIGPTEIPEGMLSIMLIADTQGSLEAIVHALPDGVHIVSQKTGEISEADVLFAKSTNAIMLSFNTKIRSEVAQFALLEKVLLKNYSIIYEMLQEIKDVMEGKRLALVEQIFGTAKVLAKFPFDKTWILGISVLDGRIARNDKIRLIRGDDIIGESTIVSIKHNKDTVSKIEKGQEGGIALSPFLDFELGDMLVSHS